MNNEQIVKVGQVWKNVDKKHVLALVFKIDTQHGIIYYQNLGWRLSISTSKTGIFAYWCENWWEDWEQI